MAAPVPASAVDWDALVRHPEVTALCALALQEDLGTTGDVTTNAVFAGPQLVRAQIAARTPTVVCGMPLVRHLLQTAAAGAHALAAGEVVIERCAVEGTPVDKGEVLLRVVCDVRLLLALERTLLNFAIRLCGIAAGTRKAVACIPSDCKAQLLDTRKTTPGWRRLEKAAVRTGGGVNHRIGLFDAVLIKDNHVAAAGSVSAAVQRARAKVGRQLSIEVEVDTLAQLAEALAAGPDMILLDNFSLADLRTAVDRVAGRVPLEASGGVTLATLPAIAQTGVDRISMGALTHSSMPADLGLDLLP